MLKYDTSLNIFEDRYREKEFSTVRINSQFHVKAITEFTNKTFTVIGYFNGRGGEELCYKTLEFNKDSSYLGNIAFNHILQYLKNIYPEVFII